jgi:hypothetical protein
MLYPCHMLAYPSAFYIDRKHLFAKGKAQKKQTPRLAAAK